MRKVIIALSIVIFGIILSVGVFAQAPRPPLNQGAAGNQPPGNSPAGAPIDPGTGILLILAAAYGFKKVQVARKLQN